MTLFKISIEDVVKSKVVENKLYVCNDSNPHTRNEHTKEWIQ